jgi:hypothetical protein
MERIEKVSDHIPLLTSFSMSGEQCSVSRVKELLKSFYQDIKLLLMFLKHPETEI